MSVTLNGWPKNLKWSDFTRTTTKAGDWDAQTAPRREYQYNYQPIGGQFYIKGVVTVRLNKPATLVKKAFMDSAGDADKQSLLKHEQGHYDIAGLIARDFHLCLNNIAESTKPAAKARIDACWDWATAMLNLLDDGDSGLYERAVNHSRNQIGQDRWNRIFEFASYNLDKFTFHHVLGLHIDATLPEAPPELPRYRVTSYGEGQCW
ncbi:MAG: hypothetical protein KDA89_12665 [Planctomycetaceae bacterium]|nr:hypothetical protein [Planctomycetaceae bacterium]